MSFEISYDTPLGMMFLEILDLIEQRVTGDRPLKEHEKRLFLAHDQLFYSVLREEAFKGGEPTLYDATIIELMGRQDAQINIVVEQGAKMQMLETNIEILAETVKGFQELLKKRDARRGE